ncbi:MAG: FAD-binding oxidoreductase [Acidobacteriota bacterium]|nr:FAD-binding oxidoreductase [Acidobacteriota bacterium]
MNPLEEKLREKVRGEVRFDAGSRALYATDASNYRQPPLGVVIPLDVEDIVQTVAVAREFGAPLLPRGAGTSLAGQCCNVAVVLDTSKFVSNILEIDPDLRTARVQPGVVLDRLRRDAAQHGLTFAPDPATHNRCTLGGMIGNNSCGAHSLMGGNTVDNVEELEILTYDGLRMRVGATPPQTLESIIQEGGPRGKIYAALRDLRDRYADQVRARFPRIPRRVSGYNLDQLLPENGFHVARALVGAEGTCVTVLDARVRLVTNPDFRVLVVLGFQDLPSAADSVDLILSSKPIALEGVGRSMLAPFEDKTGLRKTLALLPEGEGLLLAEFGASSAEGARHVAETMMKEMSRQTPAPAMNLFEDAREMKAVWEIREVALAAGSLDKEGNESWGGWEDAAVPPSRLGDYLRAFDRLLDQHHYRGLPYGHFGQGCIHVRINFDFSSAQGISKFRSFIEEAADLVVSFGGSLSGEHGDGQARAELYPKMFGAELVGAFREFKTIWDPNGKMNPGKVVDPNRLDENLRVGLSYKPWKPRTTFGFPQDRGSFERASARCIGVGKCRREGGDTMCPSYRVTHEEEHSTRGRARLLSEMLRGEVLTGKWRDERVREALDLCLACKGCKAECPVSVDMATYKAEFLSHYYRGRIRPASAYAFGMIFRWARIGSCFPLLANFFTEQPLLARMVKRVIGIAPQRTIPPLAQETFKAWFRKQIPANPHGDPVVLWADTFNNYFSPDVLKAAVVALEAAGFRAIVPSEPLCCGRPLYDYGMLGLARKKLKGVLRALRSDAGAGTPVVGVEPGCMGVFRDELLNLFPGDKAADLLASQSFMLGDFLVQRGYQPPRLARKALVHGHCHQKALSGMTGDLQLLRGMGINFDLIDSGCCGMAGGFGYEKEHYEVSVKAGELVLLPAIRNAPEDTLIVTDGFSCREQIFQCTGRRAIHLAEALKMAIYEA